MSIRFIGNIGNFEKGSDKEISIGSEKSKIKLNIIVTSVYLISVGQTIFMGVCILVQKL